MPAANSAPNVALRRRKVASYMARRMTQAEIIEALPIGNKGIVNPETGKPFGQTTISKDMRWVEAQWAKEAGQDLMEIKAAHLAETREARKAAWARHNLPMVYKGLLHEANVMGLFAPKQAEVDVSGDVTHTNAVGGTLETSDEIRRIEEHIAQLEEKIELDGR